MASGYASGPSGSLCGHVVGAGVLHGRLLRRRDREEPHLDSDHSAQLPYAPCDGQGNRGRLQQHQWQPQRGEQECGMMGWPF